MYNKVNSFNDLARFFSTSERPVDAFEFVLFWQSLSYEERVYYRTVRLV